MYFCRDAVRHDAFDFLSGRGRGATTVKLLIIDRDQVFPKAGLQSAMQPGLAHVQVGGSRGSEDDPARRQVKVNQ